MYSTEDIVNKLTEENDSTAVAIVRQEGKEYAANKFVCVLIGAEKQSITGKKVDSTVHSSIQGSDIPAAIYALGLCVNTLAERAEEMSPYVQFQVDQVFMKLAEEVAQNRRKKESSPIEQLMRELGLL
jgi:hypothetical protein